MNTINNIKKMIRTSLILLMTVLVPLGVCASTTLEKGIYTINNEVNHDNPVGVGMARSYTEQVSTVEVNNEGTFVTLGFNNTQFMGDFVIKNKGNTLNYEVSKHDATTNLKELRFKLPSVAETITVGLYVIPMDVTVEYQVSFNQNTLKLVQKIEEPVQQQQETVAPEPVAPVEKVEATVETPKMEKEETKAVSTTQIAEKKQEDTKVEVQDTTKDTTKDTGETSKEVDRVEISNEEVEEQDLQEIAEDSMEEAIADEVEVEQEEIEQEKIEEELIEEETKSNTMIYVVGTMIIVAIAVAVGIIIKKK